MDGFFSRLSLSNEPWFRLGRHFIFWFAWWIFFGFIYGFPMSSGAAHPLQLSLAYLEALLYMPQHMILSYGILYFILPKLILKGSWWSGLLSVIGLIFVAAMLSQIVANYAIVPIREALQVPYRPSTKFYASLMAGLRGSMTVAGFAVAIKLIKLWYIKKIDNERLEKAALRAELEILKGQLHPHFMFNTLNTIYSFSLNGSEKTSPAILSLSQLMRYMLTDCAQPSVELNREIQILMDYISLEKERFAQRLDISINVSGDLDNKQIPPLLLMPFVENSFKHGANEMVDQAWISLDLSVQNEILKFKLINAKPNYPYNTAKLPHVGLANVKRRLELLYPQGHDLRITEDEDSFVVSLILHLNKSTPAEMYGHIPMPPR